MEKIRKEKEERNFIFYRLKTGEIQYHQVIKEKKTKQTSTYTEQNYQMFTKQMHRGEKFNTEKI